MSKINVAMDATQLDTLQSCEFKMYLRHELNKDVLIKAEALDRGDLMHHAKEGYYKALASRETWENSVEAGVLALRMRITEESDLPMNEALRQVPIFIENVTRWRGWDESIQIKAVEQPFSYLLYEDETFRFILNGKIDLLFSDNNYENCPMDTKTYTRDWPLTRWRNQFMGYSIATKSNFLFVDRVGLQGLPGEVKKPMTPEEKHKRFPLSYDPLIKKSWINNTIKWYLRYYDCVSNNDWPQNLTGCDKFNRLCEYHDDVCNVSGEENRQINIETKFKNVSPWDVSAKLGLNREKVNG